MNGRRATLDMVIDPVAPARQTGELFSNPAVERRLAAQGLPHAVVIGPPVEREVLSDR